MKAPPKRRSTAFRFDEPPRRHVRSTMRVIAVLACLALLISGGVMLGRYFLRTRQTVQINEELEQLYETAAQQQEDMPSSKMPDEEPSFTGFQYIGTSMLPESQTLYDLNPDYIGWLRIPNVLKQPVVYRNNAFYLDHDFYGNYSDAGTAFLNYEHPFSEFSQYLVIHGHSMHDGTMFGRLLQYRKRSYFEANPYLYFTTLYRNETYKAFAVTETPESEMYGLLRLGAPVFSGEAEFVSFIDNLCAHAVHFSDEPVEPGSAILALSTCHDDQRVTVFFKRIDSEPSGS